MTKDLRFVNLQLNNNKSSNIDGQINANIVKCQSIVRHNSNANQIIRATAKNRPKQKRS